VALWRSLPAPHRRWIVVNAIFATALINLVVNGAVAWLFTLGQSDVPFWARPFSETSTLGDTLGTIFVLPLITGLLCTLAVRREVAAGALEAIRPGAPFDSWLARLPPPGLRRDIAFGGIAFSVLALPVSVVLAAIDFGTLSCGQFVAFKVAFAIVLGALVTPLIAICAMADQPRP
jgi:hypothetical protein